MANKIETSSKKRQTKDKFKPQRIHSCETFCQAIFFNVKINKNHRTYNSLFCLIILVIIFNYVCNLI